MVSDPNNKLGTNQPWSNFPASPTQVVATLIVPRIEVTWGESVGNTTLDANPNIGGGMRVYPDQQTPTDTANRRQVVVHIKTTPPVPGRQIRLKSFDVDDPTRDDFSFNIDTNDFAGVQVP